jgi:hypothetical protein
MILSTLAACSQRIMPLTETHSGRPILRQSPFCCC